MWIQNILLTNAVNIYTLVFNCNVGIISGILFVVAVFDTLINPYIGFIQDKERLSKLFSSDTYGRRAPWFITHFPLLLLSIVLCTFPPQKPGSEPTWITYVWYAIVMIIGKWASSVVGIAVMSAIDEIFPAQMERVQIWGMTVFTIWIGILIAVVSSNMIIGDADNSPERCCGAEFDNNLANRCEKVINATTNLTTYVFSDEISLERSTTAMTTFVMFVSSLVGFFGISTMKLAKQPANKDEVGSSMWENIKYFAAWPAFRLYFIHIMAESLGNIMLTTFAAYYITFVLAFPRDEFASALIFITLIGVCVQYLTAGIGSWLFGTESRTSVAGSRSVVPYGIAGCVISAVLTTLLLVLADKGYEDDGVTKKKGDFFLLCASFGVSRFFQTPSQIFNSVARGWIVDLDVQRSKSTKRREALIHSLSSIAVNLSGILVTPLLASLSVAGLDTTLCWGESQDETAVAYLKWLLIIISPLLLLLRAYCINAFPITESMVLEIENKQKEIYVRVKKQSGGAKVVPSK